MKRSSSSRAREAGQIRVDVRYEGRVQGVGFRFTAVSAAEGLAVSGWVANAPDGSVRLVAEGAEAEVQRLLHAIRTSSLGRHIQDERVRTEAPRGDLGRFSVRARSDDG